MGLGDARGIRGDSSEKALPQTGGLDLQSVMGTMSNGDLVRAFLSWMNSRAMSRNTIRRRAVSINGFARAIEPITLASAQAEDVEDWLATKRAPRTRHAYRSDLSAFYKWAIRRRFMTRNPVAETDAIIVPKSLPKPIATADLERVLVLASDRVRLALMLAAYASLRCSEIANLTTTDTQGGLIVVRDGKGRKDRAIPIHPMLEAELRTWKLPAGARYIEITADRLGRVVSDHLRRCGVEATLHCGRHSFGTEAARVLGDIMKVAQLMGHENPATSMGYVRLAAPGYEGVASMYRLGA